MTALKTWISATRLRTLPLSISGALVGSSYAYFLGFFDGFIFILITLTTLSFQILSNLANDYGDGIRGTDNPSRIGPERAIQSGAVSPKQMRLAIILNAFISTGLVIALIWLSFGVEHLVKSIIFLLLGGLSIWAAISYTIGNTAYGYRALGDLMVFLFFGLLSVFGTFFLFSKQIDIRLLLPASAVGFLSTAVLNLNNMRDLKSDKNSQKYTLAGYMGRKNSKVYHFALILSAIILMIVFQLIMSFSNLMLFSWVAFAPLLFHLKIVYGIKNPKRFDPHLKLVALSTFVMSLLFASVLVIEQLRQFL
jgi:1,4-dihydroxy-2-naphthoate octaprenyltransferase